MNLLTERLKELKSKNIILYLLNNFRYEGKIINSDENYVEIVDYKGLHVININQIRQVDEVKE